MHKRSCGLKRVVAARFTLVCVLNLCLLAPAGAVLLGQQDTPPQDASQDPNSDLVHTTVPADLSAEELAVWQRAAGTPIAKPDPTQQTDHPAAAPAAAPTLAVQVPAPHPVTASARSADNADADMGQSIHSAVKESIRPVYEQLVESGAVETWHDVKASLGLDKPQWTDHDKGGDPAKPPGQWEASGGGGMQVAPPPRTEAQAKIDREMATMMREKLIDQITPWAIGLVVLYVVGYLVKLLVSYVRWKTGKRNQRRIARAQRHTSRRIRSATKTTSSSPSASSAKTGSKETV